MLIDPSQVPQQTTTGYPTPFVPIVTGRIKQRVGDAAGLANFGVNLVTLLPGAASALRHWHSHQDEFVYVLTGELILVTDAGESPLEAGMMAGFAANQPNGHQLVNRSQAPAQYLEIGDRTPDDCVQYPDDDLLAKSVDGRYHFTRKDGSSYA
ncbi:MAG: cupin domain-containing protein [Cyanothece sp. SIO2G6]|nr:cupin domain-containing protein [Cyanothece sp. SIO2G6]